MSEKQVIVVTPPTVPGYHIVKVLGTAHGLTVCTRGVCGKIVAGIDRIFGGEVTSYSYEAEKDRARPKHIFVISLDEMTEYSMGGKRKSAVFTKKSFFIEFSENEDFYHKRKWHPQRPSALEESLFRNSKEHEMRWRKLKKNGLLS